ncbi:hypothetical protein [Halodurantibacterium flavum]|uniref:Lipoprotein n=1 Tax=Halodurantibacterium flavum TaxID=1382802 RepID=A0ABW4S9M8_9RHOB
MTHVRTSLTVMVLAGLAACAQPQDMSGDALCAAIRANQMFPSAARGQELRSEYARRNPGYSARTVDAVLRGSVFVGMDEYAATCSWGAELAGETMGYGQHTRQYRSGGGASFFFVNARTGQVEYISS